MLWLSNSHRKKRESKQNGLPGSNGELLKALNTLLQFQQQYMSRNSQKSFSNSQNTKYKNNSFKTNKLHQDMRPQGQQSSNRRQNNTAHTNQTDLTKEPQSSYSDPDYFDSEESHEQLNLTEDSKN